LLLTEREFPQKGEKNDSSGFILYTLRECGVIDVRPRAGWKPALQLGRHRFTRDPIQQLVEKPFSRVIPGNAATRNLSFSQLSNRERFLAALGMTTQLIFFNGLLHAEHCFTRSDFVVDGQVTLANRGLA